MEYDLRFGLVRTIAWARRKLGIRMGHRFINHVLYPTLLREQQAKEAVIRYDNYFSLHLNTRFWIEWCVFLDGYFEYPVTKLMKRIVKQGDIVFDVGANIGAHTLTLSHLVGQTGKVIAIEPCTPVLEKLRKNLHFNNTSNVTLLPYAISDEMGTRSLYWRENDFNQGQATFWSNEGTNTNEKVETITLDEVMHRCRLSHVTLIKIDIQGAEYKALRGASTTLSAYKPAIIFEHDWNWGAAGTSFEEAKTYLAHLGYKLYSISSRGKPIDLQKSLSGEILALSQNNPFNAYDI